MKKIPYRILLSITLAITLARPVNSQVYSPHTTAPIPDPVVTIEGREVEDPGRWEALRREEILGLFKDHVYGRVPDYEPAVSFEEVFNDRRALDGTAVQKEVKIRVSNGSDTLNINMLLFLPGDAGRPVPVFLGLNFYGNQTVHPDPQISLTNSWVANNKAFWIRDNRTTEDSRGVRSIRWPVEMILERGYGLATIYYGDIDPDFHDGFENGIHGLFPESGTVRSPSAWGSISAWAWGLSRAMDYLQTDPEVDGARVAVIGHSRLGKTALWAGALDRRFAMVVSNNSGCGGAALSRRIAGESVAAINRSFPHWFAARFHTYDDSEEELPVDQHMLLSLVAPRPLYVASAQEDTWADPQGEYLSMFYAGPVYGLYGQEVFEEDGLPPVNQPRWSGKLGYHIRSGGHNLTRYDWQQFMDFADLHLKSARESGINTQEIREDISTVDPAGIPAPGGTLAENPVTVDWIREHIRYGHPRLILTPGLEAEIRDQHHRGEDLTEMGYRLLLSNAESFLDREPLRYNKTGRRLLGVSREAISRLTTLALAYRLERDQRYLSKLQAELEAVCSFDNWNPSHFLDVAEMAAGVALALDWAGEWLPEATLELARTALVQKAMQPGLADESRNNWVNAHHNWNLVCHGGLSLAALCMFEEEPELSARILHRAVEKIPLALVPYAPDGVYPEGPAYWFYATTYLVAALSSFESSLDTGFGFDRYPGVQESATFSRMLAGPSGDYFDYFDAGLEGYLGLTHFGLLSWFALHSDGGIDRAAYLDLLEQENRDPDLVGRTRFYSMHFLHTVRMLEEEGISDVDASMPTVWIGEGEEPIAVFRDSGNQPAGFFLASKGGRAADNHGNMDAGTFVFELNGVRWAVDPGNQGYHELEEIMGGELWNSDQESGRWTLLTKNNFGHSTLTVNGQLHIADARALMIRQDHRDESPTVTFDLTPVFGDAADRVHRTFKRLPGNRLQVRDAIEFSPATSTLTWQMVTRAEVRETTDGLLLDQEGKKLVLKPEGDVPFRVEVVQLSPPPLSYDKDMPGLKRIELIFDREDFNGNSGEIVLEMAAAGSVEQRTGTADEMKGAGTTAGMNDRPNIVWIVSEDNSKHYMKLFDAHGIATPNIEKLAREGITFHRAFSNAPVCSVARSTLISSCYAPRTGTQYHRKYRPVLMPAGVEMFPAYLRQAGYYTTNNHKEDYNYIKESDVWDESSQSAHWQNRRANQPFFHMESHPASHESSLHFSRELVENYSPVTDPAGVFLFPNHPDTDLFRFTAAYYRDRILKIDTIVGRVLRQLEEEGQLENTFVFYFSDHGGVLPGSKGYLHETGLQIPLVVRIPKNFRHLVELPGGSRTGGFVSFVDFGPTLLHLAGIDVPEEVDGRPFLGRGISADELEQRDTTYGYADRFDEKYDMVRSVRIGKYKYIRSYQPFNPDALYNYYRYINLAYRQWREMFLQGELDSIQGRFFLPREPEALYDLESDPFETVNLAGEPGYWDVLSEMRTALTSWVKGMPDLSFFPEPVLVDHALDNPVAFGKQYDQHIESLVNIADLQLLPFDFAQEGILRALQSGDPWQRYWGLIDCTAFGEEAAPFYDLAGKLLRDKHLLVRVRAAEFLGLTGRLDPSTVLTRALHRSGDPMEALLILNTMVLLMDSPQQVRFELDPDRISPVVSGQEWIRQRLTYIRQRMDEAK